jgi:hypothetical protein
LIKPLNYTLQQCLQLCGCGVVTESRGTQCTPTSVDIKQGNPGARVRRDDEGRIAPVVAAYVIPPTTGRGREHGVAVADDAVAGVGRRADGGGGVGDRTHCSRGTVQ